MAAPGRNFVINLIGNSAPAEKAFRDVGRAAGRLPGPVGIATAAITASFVAVVAVVGKVTKELFDLGQEFDDVYDNIRIQTGMTGEALGALQDSFRTLATQVPNQFGDIGIAVQDLNTRLGVTGEPLEQLAEQLLTVTRLMGGDIAGNVRTTTRLFNDFSVAAENQAEVLDFLFKAAQASGQTFDILADQTVGVGAEARSLGFSLEDTVAMLALFERTGVNTENVISGLRLAVARLAKDGSDIPTAFREIIDTIRTTTDDAEANALAMELVGSRYQQNFIDTIRGGKFDIDDFVTALEASNETIMGAAEDTDGFRESWDRFKNYLKITLEPVATQVFSDLEGLIGELQPAVERVKQAFEEEGLQGALEQVAEEWDIIYRERIEPLWLRFLEFLDTTVKPLAIELGKQIGEAIASGIGNAVKDFFSRGIFGDGIPDDVLSADDRSRLEAALQTGRAGPTFMPSMGGAPTIPPTPAPPRPTPPPRPSPSSNPSGSGASGRTGTPSGGRSVEYAPGLFAYVPFADGGIVTSPTLGLVGEAGPEAIIPLDEMGRMGGGQTTVNVTVTSADPEAVVEAIRRYTRGNGPLGQVVSL